MGGSRPMVPPPSISMLGTPKATGDMLTMKRPNSNRVGGIRSITPPRSIAQTPAKGLGVQNTTFEAAQKAAPKASPAGMNRQIAPPAGVEYSNKYGGMGMGAMPVDAGRANQGTSIRSIVPPVGSGAVSEFGGGGYDGDAFMSKFAKDLNEAVKDPEPTRENKYGLDAIKAHSLPENTVKRDAPVAPSGRRDISPPNSISSHPSNMTIGNSQMASVKVERDVPGMPRDIVSKGVSPENKYGADGSRFAMSSTLDKGAPTIGSPNFRQISPPDSISLVGAGAIDGDSYMEVHAHKVAELGLQTPMSGARPNTGFSIEKVEQIAKAEPVIPTPK